MIRDDNGDLYIKISTGIPMWGFFPYGDGDRDKNYAPTPERYLPQELIYVFLCICKWNWNSSSNMKIMKTFGVLLMTFDIVELFHISLLFIFYVLVMVVT